MISKLYVSNVNNRTDKFVFDNNMSRAGIYERTRKGTDDEDVEGRERTVMKIDDMDDNEKTSANHEHDNVPRIKGGSVGQISVKNKGRAPKNSSRRDSQGRLQSTKIKGTDYYQFLDKFDHNIKRCR